MRFLALLISIGTMFVTAAFSHAQTASSAQVSPSPSPSPAVAQPEKTPDKVWQKTVPEAGPPKAPSSSGGGMEILSDTMGVDFKPYLKGFKETVQKHWYSLMPRSAMTPEMKYGKTVIKFAVLRDGRLANVKVEESSGDQELDRAAYGALTDSSPVARLPVEFAGEYLLIRASFFYNPAKGQSRPEEKKDQDADKTNKWNPRKESAHP